VTKKTRVLHYQKSIFLIFKIVYFSFRDLNKLAKTRREDKIRKKIAGKRIDATTKTPIPLSPRKRKSDDLESSTAKRSKVFAAKVPKLKRKRAPSSAPSKKMKKTTTSPTSETTKKIQKNQQMSLQKKSVRSYRRNNSDKNSLE